MMKRVTSRERAGASRTLAPRVALAECRDRIDDDFVFVAFPPSRSENLPIALNLAKSATAYGEQDIAGRTLYWAGFADSVADLDRAAHLINIAGSWVGSMVRIGNQHVTKPVHASFILGCHVDRLRCSSKAAHCHKVIDDPFGVQEPWAPLRRSAPKDHAVIEARRVKVYEFPCKHMLGYGPFHSPFRFEIGSSASPQDQIQAAAVAHGYALCPSFDAAAFREVGTREELVETPIAEPKSTTVEATVPEKRAAPEGR